MTRLQLTILVGAALVGGFCLGLFPGRAQMDHGTMHGTPASAAYMDAMGKMDAEMADIPMTGKPGIDFALMMIPHHQSGIDMAKAYLASGEGDADLIKLSNEIIEAQEREIAFLKAWLSKNRP